MLRRHTQKTSTPQQTNWDAKKNTHRQHHRLLGAFLGTLVLSLSILGYGWTRLQPSRHFESLQPVGLPMPSNPPVSPEKVQVPPRQGIVNILLIGSDQRPGETAGHSDSMVLIHANLNSHQYSLLSIPRDTRIRLPGAGYTKLTSVQYIQQIRRGPQQGIVDAVQSVSRLTGIPIDYYVETNYTGLQKIVNAIGGIEMELPFNVTLTHPWNPHWVGKRFAKGKHFLDGQAVTEVVHERDSVPGTDYGRQQLQGQALIGMARATLNPRNLLRLPAFYETLPNFLVATNLSKWDMLSLALGAGEDFHPEQQIHYYQVPGTSETLHDDVLGSDNNQVVINAFALRKTIQDHFKEEQPFSE